jgi:TolB-like protein
MRAISTAIATSAVLALSVTFVMAAPPASKAVFVRLVVNQDGHRQRLVGVLESENDEEVKLFDLKTRETRTIKRDQVALLRKNISRQEAVEEVGIAPFVAYEIRHSLPITGRMGKVAAIDFATIYVTLGQDNGIREGEELQVYRGQLEIKDPDTGKVLGQQRRKLAKLQVTEVQEKLSKAKLLGDSEVQIEVGDAVRSLNAEKPVAVLPFADENGQITAGALALSEQLIGELVQNKVPTVERTRLAEVLTELALQNTGLFDANSQQRIGKQLGAYALITGTVIPTSKGKRSQITIRMTNVQTGTVVYGSTYIAWPLDQSLVRRHEPATVQSEPAKAMIVQTPVSDKRTQYINATYHGVIRLRNGRWEAVDQTGKVHSTYEYVGRTDEYVELIDRGLPTRLYADHIDQKLNGNWSRVADGHWITSPK